VAVGCARIADPEPSPGRPHAEIGTGTAAWAPIQDGQVLPVERGSQGGVHVRGSVRAWGIDGGSIDDVDAWTHQDRPTIDFELRNEDGVLSIDDPLRRALVPADDGSGALELLGVIVQFHHWVDLPEDWSGIDWAAEEERLETLDLELFVSVTDRNGVAVEDIRTVRVDFPPRPDDDSTTRTLAWRSPAP
jgi:hypothetical protein